MDMIVIGEFGMEGRRHGLTLTYPDRIIIRLCQDFHIFADARDLRSANKDHLKGLTMAVLIGRTDVRVELTAVGVATNPDVERAEAFLCRVFDVLREQDRTGAGAKRGLQTNEIAELLEESAVLQKLEHSRRLAAWNHDAIETIEFFRLADEPDISAKLFQPTAMRVEIA